MSATRRPEPKRLPARQSGSSSKQGEFLDLVIDAIPCMVFVKDASDLTYVSINRLARETLGVREAEVVGKTDLAVFSPEEALRIQADDRRVVELGTVGAVLEERLETKRGIRWFATRKVAVTGIQGGPSSVLFTFSEDITERKELRTTAAMWDQVFRYAERGIVVGSPNGHTLEMMNPAFPLMLGYEIEELAGTPLMDIFAPEVRANVAAMLELVRRTGQHTFESTCLRKNGTTFPVLIDATSVKDAKGHVHHRAIRIQDATLLKSAENVLLADRFEAERANQAKSIFLSRMSHELRTPLNVILGFAQVMQLDELNDLQTESVGHILQAGRHLLALIDEALDISRVESGQLALSLESVNVKDAVDEVFALMQPLADAKGVRFMADANHNHCFVVADRQRLKQVLLNLIANGVNYNVPGGTLEVSCAPAGTCIEISVADTGIGIPEHSTDRLFAPFDRLGKEGSEVEGTGLGLSLSKALVEAMGGTISAKRNADVGSTFTVSLKASERVDASPPLARETSGSTPGRKGLILHIENNLVNFRLVEQVLARRPGVRIIPAMQARLGLQLARDHRPDLIILDLHLPDLSGEETLRRLLNSPETKGIPVIIASADATPRRLEQLLKLGARDYLTKPIDVRQLLKLIDELLPAQDQQEPG